MRRAGLAFVRCVIITLCPLPSAAQDGRVITVSKAPFACVVTALEQAIDEEKLALIRRADAE